MSIKKILYIVIGCISVGLGTVGAVTPFLPSVPFLLLAAFCFARSSERLNTWFTGTKLYQDNLADYTAGRGMTKKAKIRIMVTVTLLMSIGFILMGLKRHRSWLCGTLVRMGVSPCLFCLYGQDDSLVVGR